MPRLEVLIQGWFSLWVLTYSAVALCYYNLVSASHQEQSSIFFSVYNAEYSVLTAHLTLAVSSGDSSNETLTFSPVLFASGLVSFELRVTSQCTQTRSDTEHLLSAWENIHEVHYILYPRTFYTAMPCIWRVRQWSSPVFGKKSWPRVPLVSPLLTQNSGRELSRWNIWIGFQILFDACLKTQGNFFFSLYCIDLSLLQWSKWFGAVGQEVIVKYS